MQEESCDLLWKEVMIMNLHEEQQRVQKAVSNSLSHVQEDPWLTQRVLANAKGEEPVVKKVSTTFILAMAILAIAATALAAGIIYNQNWYYNDNNGRVLKENNPVAYEAILANMTENPEQSQSDSDLVDVVIQDVSWAPEAEMLTISFRASVKDPAHYELHGMWALDTDGGYIGEGGSTTVTDDSEDRAMHWLWRTFDTEEYTGPRHYGPPTEMMDDGNKKLLLIETNEISLFDGTLDVFGSMDMLRTPEGDIVFVEEVSLDWMSEEYDQKMKEYGEQHPDMSDYANARIAAAQAVRAKIADGTIPCRLTYTVVEYTEGMDDQELYTGGEHGKIDFIIRPKQTNP